jgi:cell division protein FtsQ
VADRPGTSVVASVRETTADSERHQRGVERASARARARRRRTARVAFTIATVAVVVWAGWFSPLFALDGGKLDVAVTGQSVDAADVRAALLPFVGTPLPRLDPGAMAAAVEGLGGVRTATVTRAWPDGVGVVVVARVAIAAIPAEGGAYVIVDAEGVTLGQPIVDPGVLPVVSVPVGPEYARALRAVVAVLGALPTDLRQRIQSAGAQTEDTVQFTLGDGTVVVWGSADDAALKAEVVLTLLDSGSFTAATIDVSAPTLPVTHD